MKSSAPLERRFPLTPSQVLGPYYIPNAPRRRKLFPAGARGEQIRIQGQVLSENGLPVDGAILDVWLADPNGRYDNQDDIGNSILIPRSKQVYRGRILTGSDGGFTFDCLRPGNYFDDGWNLWRPAHIHLKVNHPEYQDLVTQIYFQDDAQNCNDIPGDGFFRPELAISMSPARPHKGGIQRAIFNIALKAANQS